MPSADLKKLTINVHDSYADDAHSLDDAFSHIFDDMYDNSYAVNVTDRGDRSNMRLPNKLWSIMSRSDQKGWLNMSPEGRRAIAALLEAYQDTADRGDKQGSNNSSTRSPSSPSSHPQNSSRSIS